MVSSIKYSCFAVNLNKPVSAADVLRAKLDSSSPPCKKDSPQSTFYDFTHHLWSELWLACGVCQLTFHVRGPRGRHGRGRGLAEALKGSLLSGGVVWSPVLLLLLLLVWAHGLESQLFPACAQVPGLFYRVSQIRNNISSAVSGVGTPEAMKLLIRTLTRDPLQRHWHSYCNSNVSIDLATFPISLHNLSAYWTFWDTFIIAKHIIIKWSNESNCIKHNHNPVYLTTSAKGILVQYSLLNYLIKLWRVTIPAG